MLGWFSYVFMLWRQHKIHKSIFYPFVSHIPKPQNTTRSGAQVNTGIEIKGYQDWFPRTSTYMCWIKPTFQRRRQMAKMDEDGRFQEPNRKEGAKNRKLKMNNNNNNNKKDGMWNFKTEEFHNSHNISDNPALVLSDSDKCFWGRPSWAAEVDCISDQSIFSQWIEDERHHRMIDADGKNGQHVQFQGWKNILTHWQGSDLVLCLP